MGSQVDSMNRSPELGPTYRHARVVRREPVDSGKKTASDNFQKDINGMALTAGLPSVVANRLVQFYAESANENCSRHVIFCDEGSSKCASTCLQPLPLQVTAVGWLVKKPFCVHWCYARSSRKKKGSSPLADCHWCLRLVV